MKWHSAKRANRHSPTDIRRGLPSRAHLLHKHRGKHAPRYGPPRPLLGAVFFISITSLGGCERTERDTNETTQAPPVASPVVVTPSLPPPTDPCLEQAKSLAEGETVEGTPVFDRYRAEILGRARAVPLVFTRVPEVELSGLTDSEVGLVQKYRKRLLESQDPVPEIQTILRRTAGRYPLRRAIFLSEGYLYAQTPLLALRLSQVLRLDHLFDAPVVVVERGVETFEAFLEDGRYYLPEEPVVGVSPARTQHGPPAGLLLFDRVRSPQESSSPPLGFSLQELKDELAFDRAIPLVKGKERWVFELRTRGRKSTAVVDVRSVQATLVCESTAEERREELVRTRNRAQEERRLVEPILSAAREIVARGLPFDEPRTEEGQQDGLLRIAFRKAHRHRQETYEFNGDSYYTYDGFGRPRLPEVCIDFITDSFDWATGGYWSGRGEKAHQRKGALHFPSFGIENERSVESLLNHAAAVPKWFDVHFTDKKERVKFLYREKFFDWLSNTADVYRPGDVVFIYGLRDDEKFHYHSFFIDQKDPVTGIPTLVLANAGPPQARTIEGEMQNAPLRTLVARVRVLPDVLRRAYAQAEQHPGEPLRPPAPEFGEEGEGRPNPQSASAPPQP